MGTRRMTLSAAEFERARSWNLDIVAALLPDTRHRDEGSERRFPGLGGFTVNRRSGAWYSHSTRCGGHSPIALVMSLKSCSADEAVAWIKAFLAAHPGVGSCDGDVTDDDGTPASAAQCQAYLDVAVDVVGAADAKAYAESRGLSPPYPACVYIPHARCGEGGFAGLLT